MELVNITHSVKIAVRIAKSLAQEYGNACYCPAHLLKGILHKEVGIRDFLTNIGKDVGYLEEWAEVWIEECPKERNKIDVVPDEQVISVFEEADNVRILLGVLQIDPICVLVALAKPGVGFSSEQLKSFTIREKEIYDIYISESEVKENLAGGTKSSKESNAPVGLYKYCIDRTMQASNSEIYPIIAREKEKRMMIEILGRFGKPNVMITGDSGVGKTALLEGLACDIVSGKVPSFLKNAKILELDTGALIAGATYKGEVEDRMNKLIKELRQLDNVILFIDEIHMLVDPKQGNNGIANILKLELARGELTVIATATNDEYRKWVEPDRTFSRHFEELCISEPNDDSAIRMVKSVLGRYVEYHRLDVSDDAISTCVHLSKRYIKDRRLPDAAIDLLDRTMSAVKMVNETARESILTFSTQLSEVIRKENIEEEERLEELKMIYSSMQIQLSPVLLGMINEEANTRKMDRSKELFDYLDDTLCMLSKFVEIEIKVVEMHEIAAIVSNKTGIPIGRIQSHEKERLLKMEDILRNRVVGQDGALKVLADAILESRSGMNKVGQPIGSFFFLGPTGTGKTELAKALAEALFNDEKAMIRFDMSEFKEEHSAALLYGAPPGYVGYEEGGLLVNKIRQQPYAIVLFDEIEKAHPSVYDIFLQIMDEGKLHDRLGKEGDFSNAVILFTSNVGSEWLSHELMGGNHPDTTQIMEVMGRYFRPEFLARLSEIVPFSPITDDMLLQIFEIQFKSLKEALENKGIAIYLDDTAKRKLACKGYTSKYGARQISGVIRNYLRRPISRLIIGGELKKGDILEVSMSSDEQIVWNVKTVL